jgi:O-antigen/teichoic acid export membrane protein
MILKFVSSYEVGQATTVYSLVLLVSMFTQLGLEYPLLKNASNERSRILGTALLLELVISLGSLAIIIYCINTLFSGSLDSFTWIASLFLIISSLGFVLRFALLGISDSKNILIIDIIGMVIKFVAGFALVSTGFGAFGIVMSFTLQTIFTAGIALAVARNTFRFRLGNMQYAKQIIKDGLINTPSKFSRMLILSFSVVLLASFGISTSEVGIFYVAFTLSVIAGGLASSISFMVIPESSASRTDLSSSSLRIGLSLIAPLISALVVAPSYILSLIGPEYSSAELVLLVLSIGILPSCIIANTIAKFNNVGNTKKIVAIGLVQLFTFLTVFWLLVPLYGTLGAALATLIAFVAGSIPSIIWTQREVLKYISNSCIAIISGVASGYFLLLGFNTHPLEAALFSSAITFTVVVVLKNFTLTEIRQLVQMTLKNNTNISK